MYATTSTVVVGDDGTALVVDPGVTAHEVAGLSAAIAQRGWRPVAVWSTHGHWDHVLDGPGLHGLVRWRGGPARDVDAGWHAAVVRERDADGPLAAAVRAAASAGQDDGPPEVAPIPPVPFPRRGADHLDWSGPDVVVVEHAAHAPDHAALVVVHARVLVCGDLLSDREVPLLDTDADDPVADYRAALDLLEETADAFDVETVVPGHGTPGDRAELDRRLDADRAYLDALAGGGSDDPRLAEPWVADAHAAQVAALGG